MRRLYGGIVTIAVVLAGCSSTTDSNGTRSGWNLRGQEFSFCTPTTDPLPRLVSGKAPVYPVQRMLENEVGYAIVTFDITTEGETANISAVESSHGAFYAHAKAAIVDWQFDPAKQDGIAVQVKCLLRQNFDLPYNRYKKQRDAE